MRVMATAKYGFFFFLLSKLLAIKGSAQLSGSNGINNAWPQNPTPQGMTNDVNSYYNHPSLNSAYNTMYDSQSPINYGSQTPPTYYDSMQDSIEDSTYAYDDEAYDDEYQPTTMQYSNSNQPMDYKNYLNQYQTIDPAINSPPSVLQSPTPASQPYYTPTQSRSDLSHLTSPMEMIQDQLSKSQPQSTYIGESSIKNGNNYLNNPIQPSPMTNSQPLSFPMSPMAMIQDQLSKSQPQSTYTGESNSNNGNNNLNNPIQPPPMTNSQPLTIPMSPMAMIQDQLSKSQPQSTYTGESNSNNGNNNLNNPIQPPPMTNSQPLTIPMSPMEMIQDQLSKSQPQSTYTGESNINNGNYNLNNPIQPSPMTNSQPLTIPISPMEMIQDQLSKSQPPSTYTVESNSNNGNNNQNNPIQPPPMTNSQPLTIPISPMEMIQDQLSKSQPPSTYTGESNSNNENNNLNNPIQPPPMTNSQPLTIPMSPMEMIQDQLSKSQPQSTYTGESNSNNGNNNQNNPIQPFSITNSQPPQSSMTNSQPPQASMTNSQPPQSSMTPIEMIQDQLSKNQPQSTFTGESKSNNGNNDQINPVQPFSMTNSQPPQSSMTPMEVILDQLSKSPLSSQPQVPLNLELKPLDQISTNVNNEEKKPPTFSYSPPVSNPFSPINMSKDADLTNKPSTSQPPNQSSTSQVSMPFNDFLVNNFLKTESQVDSMNDSSLSLMSDFGNTKSGLEMQLENHFSSLPPLTGPQNNFGASNKANNKKLVNLELEEPGILNELAKYDKSYNVDVENSRSRKEDHAELLVYANPNDIHIPKLTPIQSTSTTETNIPNIDNLLNTLPTSNSQPNYNDVPNSNPLLSSLFNYDQNKIVNNKMPTDMSNSIYNGNPYDTNVGQKQTVSTNVNPLSSDADNSGYIYKQIDLTNPPPYTNSWSLSKPDYSQKKQQPIRNIDNIKSNLPMNSPEMPLRYGQNYNQGVSISPLNNMSTLNAMYALSKAINLPSGATRIIFDVTQANFPRIPIIQQIQLTYVITKSVVTGLQRMSYIRSKNLFPRQRVVKQDFNSFTPTTPIAPPKNPVELDNNFPISGFFETKNYQLSLAPTPNKPDFYQPSTTDSVQQQMYNSGTNLNYKSLDNMDYSQQARNTQLSYYTDLLANEIQNAIYSNLPDSYTRGSPEINEYIQQIILAVGIIYHDQINDVFRGSLSIPIMNIN